LVWGLCWHIFLYKTTYFTHFFNNILYSFEIFSSSQLIVSKVVLYGFAHITNSVSRWLKSIPYLDILFIHYCRIWPKTKPFVRIKMSVLDPILPPLTWHSTCFVNKWQIRTMVYSTSFHHLKLPNVQDRKLLKWSEVA